MGIGLGILAITGAIAIFGGRLFFFPLALGIVFVGWGFLRRGDDEPVDF